MSTHKEALQGSDHKRVPKDIERKPIIVGHEFCGEIVEVGRKWKDKFTPGSRFSIQPNIKYNGSMGGLGAPGYSYQYIGGAATYVVIPNEVMEQNCLLSYKSDVFFHGSLAEPMSCIVAAFRAAYHVEENYIHNMGIREGGALAILAGVGPMGLGAIDYAIHSSRKPRLLVVTDIDDKRLQRAASIYTAEDARKNGVDLRYVNTKGNADAAQPLRGLAGGRGFDDVFVFAPVRPVIEMADMILGQDGCLNFFAGPTDVKFSAELNFYDVHYLGHHIIGTSGGNTYDMIESLSLMEKGLINPTAMVTHIGGLDSVASTTLSLPQIPGGKKLIYTNIALEAYRSGRTRSKGCEGPAMR